jgi:hypothetical protein
MSASLPRRFFRLVIPAAVLVVVSAGLTSPAFAANTLITGVTFSGTGVFTSATTPNATVYATPGTTVTVTVANADGKAKCAQITAPTTPPLAVVAPQSSAPFVLSFVAPSVSTTLTVGATTGNNAAGCNNPDTMLFNYLVDSTPPTISGAASPAPNAAGWNKANTTVTWTASDTSGSGLASVSAATAVSTEGTTPVTGTARDNVGNTATASLTVKLDKTAPTITGARAPAANANGWNNTNVAVSFTGSDATSGIKSTTPLTTVSTEGLNQSVTGTAVDNADNSASTTVTGISIDKTAPTLSGVPQGAPNAANWYKSDVTVKWSASDALSGIQTPPADTLISGEGSSQTSSASVSDRAGNLTTATSSPAVKLDKTAPTTTVTAPPAWSKTDLTLTLVPSDGLSGVAATTYNLDGGATQTGTSVPVTTEGNHTLLFRSTDVAGNVETTRSVSFGTDKTPPTIGHTQSPAGNAAGWNNGDVTVTFTCSDAISGIASCTLPHTFTTGSAAPQTFTGSATDNAGNSVLDPASVKLDKTPPTIGVTLDRSANANNWYGADVVATYSCADSFSGVKSCTPAHTFGEGAAQHDTGTATDVADNTASVTTTAINVDKTDPTISGAITTLPNTHGWFAGNVVVHWTCDDNLSGVVACPADSTVTGEGGNLSTSATVSDKAGHSTTATVSGIKIDRTKPSTATSTVPSGYVNAPVTIGLLPTDNLSAVDATFYSVDGATPAVSGNSVTVSGQGTHTVQYFSVDNAGNVEDAKSFTVKLDLTRPTIVAHATPAKNAAGWNNSDVTVTFTCDDDLSGVASCAGPQTVSLDTDASVVTGVATDNAGNTQSASVTIKLDKISPTISGATDRAANAAGWYNANVTVTFSGADERSGLSSLTAPVVLADGADQHATGTAVDGADNVSSTTVSHVNIDKTAPLLSVAPTTEPNGHGWYNTDVVQHWTASDPLSGLATPVPGDSTLAIEGEGLTATASVTDKAGNATSVTSTPVKLDKTAPVTDVSAPSPWVNQDVHVTLTPNDSGSGVDETHYSVDGGDVVTGTDIYLSAEGTHTITYASSDLAGNVEGDKHVTVRIDKTKPTISHVQSPLKNGDGWNNTDVTVTFTCLDQPTLSGIATCTSPRTLTGEGANQLVDGAAADKAGNTETDQASVSIDKTAPGITVTRNPEANGYGWSKEDVTVHYVATDESSGVKTLTADQLVGEGTNQSRTGTATDAAGNSASVSINDLNVDEIAPTLVGTPTAAANSKHWYNHDVAINWVCDDNRSGVVACPANTLIDSEGELLTSTENIADKADNSTTKASVAVNIDKTPPSTTSDAPGGWSNHVVTVTLSPADSLSGVDATYFRIDGGTVQSGTVATIEEGVHTLAYWSVDNAANVETHRSVVVQVDVTDPTISHTVAPAPNAAGWNNTRPVNVHFLCADALSGVASCPSDISVLNDGANQAAPGTVVDNATNSAVDNAKVSIDTVKPIISGAPDRAANGNHWYDANVTVSFTCSDALSGVAAGGCSSPQTFGEGAGQSATGTATDIADNTDSVTVSGINIDKTAPTLSGAPTTAANGAGWYKSNVTIDWSAFDSLSGLDGLSPLPSVITGEGTDQTATTSTKDLAGNTTSATSAPVKMDQTAPGTTISDVSDWSNSAVTVTLSADDNLSGVAATYYQLDGAAAVVGNTVLVDGEGTHTLVAWSVDVADNVEAHKTTTIKIDKTAPHISHALTPAANTKGWNNTSVTVSFSCSDALSGLALVAGCSSPTIFAAEGKNQLVTGTARDKAGNTAADDAIVNIDKTPPTISVALARAANAFGWYNALVTATFDCTDQEALSGVAGCPPAQDFLQGAHQTATAVVADAAGNVSDPATITGINVDTTDPTIEGHIVGSPNGNGWFKGDVTVAWTCGDNLSGVVQCPDASTVTGEGDDLLASASVFDEAGNEATASVLHIHIDRSRPTTSTSGVPTDWVNHAVTVHLLATDGLSGIDKTYYNVDDAASNSTGTSVLLDTQGIHVVKYWSVDKAGNAENSQEFTVEIDLTRPTIQAVQAPAQNADGWNNTDVTVSFICDDDFSGIAFCPAPKTVTAEAAGTLVSGEAVDNAGNTQSDQLTVNLDKTLPTISGSTDRAPNGAGWYKADVTVSFAATDQIELSGVKSVSPSSVVGQGANQARTGTATDAAGNSATTTVSGINVDKTAPLLTVAPTTEPNSNGWYNHDVIQRWTASDALSGLATDIPDDSVLESEGAAVTVTASVTDRAANSTTTTSDPVKIDKTAPVTTVTSPSGWVNSTVHVLLSASDGTGSGVAATQYRIDGGSPISGTDIELISQGTHVVTFGSTDKADNAEALQTVTVLIDKSNPTISHSQAPVKNANEWNNTDVTVTFDCGDQADLSGVASCTSPTPVTAEGAVQTVLGTVFDHAGNTATDLAKVSIDKTKPGIGGSRTPVANGNGWNNSDVTVHFDGTDGLSGIAAVTPDAVLGEGGGQSRTGTATDLAGNSSTATVSGINVDKTAPTLVGTPTAGPNSHHWYRNNVTVGWVCDDALSGIAACPSNTVIAGEGAALTSTQTTADLADNSTTTTTAPVMIDQTNPITTATAPSGWSNAAVTVTLSADDNLSGVDATFYTLDAGAPQVGTSLTVSTEGIHTIGFWSVDNASNEETHKTVSVKVDLTNPTISASLSPAANVAGWRKTPVSVHFSCGDALSLISSCLSDTTVSTEGTSNVTGTATDNAGNHSSVTTPDIKVDQVAPAVTVGGVSDGATYVLGSAPVATCSATDGTSGLNGSCTGVVTGGLANGVGTFTYTASATDRAGNTGTRIATYKVRYGYGDTLFLQPVNDTAHQKGVATSVFNGGQTIPMKFQLRNAAGAIIQAASAPKWLTPVKGSSMSAAVNEASYSASGSSGTTYAWGGNQYSYNWNTDKSQAGFYWRVGVALDDGQTYYVNIGLR